MTITEANKIFKVWKKWCWPCHYILQSIFISKIPESFLPYSQDILEEALNIVAKQYHDAGDVKASKNIQETIVYLWLYTKDKAALQEASGILSNPKMMEAVLMHISNYKKDWIDWLERQEK